MKTSTASVINHGERISFCLPVISDFPAVHDTEFLFFEMGTAQTWTEKSS
jgi:hypothetical protein